MNRLDKDCVTMNESMDKLCEETELSNFICEECSRFIGKIIRDNFEKHKSVLNPPMNLIIFLQVSEYNFETDEY